MGMALGLRNGSIHWHDCNMRCERMMAPASATVKNTFAPNASRKRTFSDQPYIFLPVLLRHYAFIVCRFSQQHRRHAALY